MKGQNYIVFPVWVHGQRRYKMILIPRSRIPKSQTNHPVGKCSKFFKGIKDYKSMFKQRHHAKRLKLNSQYF